MTDLTLVQVAQAFQDNVAIERLAYGDWVDCARDNVIYPMAAYRYKPKEAKKDYTLVIVRRGNCRGSTVEYKHFIGTISDISEAYEMGSIIAQGRIDAIFEGHLTNVSI